MPETITLSQALTPCKTYVAPEVSKVTKQIILVKERDSEFKIEIEHNLGNFNRLPLTLSGLAREFRVTAFDSEWPVDKFASIFQLMLKKQYLQKEISKINKKIHAARTSNKIDLKKYQLSRIYLSRIKEYLEFGNAVIKKIFNTVTRFNTEEKLEALANMACFEKEFKKPVYDYVIDYLTFFSLIFCLQKKKKIFQEGIFNRVQLYDADLTRKHKELMEKLLS